MRGDPTQHTLHAEPTLAATLDRMAQSPHTLLAGGTELMVAFNAGRLPIRPLLSIAHLNELRFITVTPTEITLGALTTFTDIRHHPIIQSDFPLLAQAATWIGSIANQNRATLAGNLVNASPAADSAPPLLCYDPTLTLIASNGTRTLPYTAFHRAYKQTALRPDELLHSLTLPRNFALYTPFLRKVGTRNAQAISKLALATLTRIVDGCVEDIRIAAASLAPTPLRCHAAERALLHRTLTPQTIAEARRALLAEAHPIDDIRSTAAYRLQVAANLLTQSLTALCTA